ncbi:VOC family protein [Sphingobacterium suaedae]|uniref:VOC family protein n=1 Tax=Sphingobacterium suaedae TaxID=1686402 RepID=A0ABW5KGL7_9SPHI
MKINQIYINLPVKNVQQTRAFWTALGFSVNEQFSDENAICVVIQEERIYAMFLHENFFQTFTNRPLTQGDTTQVLLALGVDTRSDVDRLIKTALENGGTTYSEPQDHGWMYQHAFSDINGHQWEVAFADPTQFPTE